MDDLQLENREKLSRFYSELRKLSFPTSPISMELVNFVTTSFERYFENDKKSLDDSFSLKPKRGAKRLPRDFHLERAKRIIRLQNEGKTWIQVVDELAGKDGMPSDEREIRRIAERYRVEIMAESIKPEDLFDD
ncbi:hypothetical protein [Methylomonas rivi]|uniref:Uncharacterized protein n=1 Tax=Methylomonas rivi TaxID=2952226 RepID=A0ABT1U691_9GAMM|nr:hypothetical protein [Methylomonas sp. WSC-6]MCQ8128571.1 hypothetical protein [Methylomonas sp. WSC-6]